MEEIPIQLHSILGVARLKHIAKGQVILYQNDQITDVCFISKGTIKVYDIDEQGNEKILHLLQSPALIPFAFFSGLSTRTRWFYSALTDCAVYETSKTTLMNKVRTDNPNELVFKRNA